MSEIIQQNTSEWREQRRGMFTSSKINSLMAQKGLGLGADTYCFELAVDIVFGLDDLEEEFESYDMRRGNELEPIAFQIFKERKEKDFIDVTQCGFIRLNDHTGSSPDGLTSDNSVLEIKAPKKDKFMRLVYDEKIDQTYIDQMQHQMWCTGSERAYFVNFIIFNGQPLDHEIVVLRDEERIELMKARISQALPIRDMYVEKLMEKFNIK